MAFSLKNPFSKRGPVIPVVKLSGAIGAVMPLRSGVSLSALESPLERAFGIKSAPAVVIVINSPGGSAVQSHFIYKRIRALAEEKQKQVIVAVEDVAASGGYLVALAGDEIIADASSIVGSIGVIAAMFGFPKLLDRIGVERRVHTAGENKDMLDPFQPERPEDVARLQTLQQEIHAAFIGLVKTRRGAALSNDPELFTGAFWTGSRGLSLGLVDRIGDFREVVRERYGEDVVIRTIAAEKGFLRRRLGLTSGDTAVFSLIDRLAATIEERLLWNRFGL